MKLNEFVGWLALAIAVLCLINLVKFQKNYSGHTHTEIVELYKALANHKEAIEKLYNK